MTRDLSFPGMRQQFQDKIFQAAASQSIHQSTIHVLLVASKPNNYTFLSNFQSCSSKENGFFRQHGQNCVHRHISGSCSVQWGNLHSCANCGIESALEFFCDVARQNSQTVRSHCGQQCQQRPSQYNSSLGCNRKINR